ncbi:hypothetical protein POM88_007044 [Heracleum sosnowskyi]|uniref:KIB1-4 beta-propeller domain-containing protein n=1 Tax=Heracleum sosnowskyi TaxID=360622 RepID=A0AAD8J6N8_9APIA|nr:hypothetical protein POM88_007044 [Heracleum sosnowskyi]
MILSKLSSINIQNFQAVCPPWRKAAKSYTSNSSYTNLQQLPWLFLPREHEDDYDFLPDIDTVEVFKFPKTDDNGFDVVPYSGSTESIMHFKSVHELRGYFFSNAVISSNPYYGWEVWMLLGEYDDTYSDIVCYDDRFFALNYPDKVELWDTNIYTPQIHTDFVVPLPEKILETQTSLQNFHMCRTYLVKSCEDLLLVQRYIGDFLDKDGPDHGEDIYKTLTFDVFKLDFDMNKWVECDVGTEVTEPSPIWVDPKVMLQSWAWNAKNWISLFAKNPFFAQCLGHLLESVDSQNSDLEKLLKAIRQLHDLINQDIRLVEYLTHGDVMHLLLSVIKTPAHVGLLNDPSTDINIAVVIALTRLVIAYRECYVLIIRTNALEIVQKIVLEDRDIEPMHLLLTIPILLLITLNCWHATISIELGGEMWNRLIKILVQRMSKSIQHLCITHDCGEPIISESIVIVGSALGVVRNIARWGPSDQIQTLAIDNFASDMPPEDVMF